MLGREEHLRRKREWMRKWNQEHPGLAAQRQMAKRRANGMKPWAERVLPPRPSMSAEEKRQKEREYWAQNKDKKSAKNSRHHERHRERGLQQSREWRLSNPERSLAAKKAWLERNREAVKERAIQRLRLPENKEKALAISRTRRARKLGVGGKHTPADIARLFDLQGGKCTTCKIKLHKTGPKKFHVDHVMPISRGGSNGPENLQLLCRSCNLRKHDMDPQEWANKHGLLFT